MTRNSVVLWLMAVLAACAEEPTDAPAQRAQLPLAEEVRDTPLVVSVALASAGGDVNFARGPSDGLDLVVTNHWSEDAEVALTASSTSEAGNTNVELTRFSLSAGASESVEVDASALGLPAGDFDFSGSLMIRAELGLGNGDVALSDPLTLSFHPTPAGWQIYDASHRESDWHGGALSERARRMRNDVLARMSEDSRLTWIGRAIGRKASDSTDWKPEPDGPADND